jgi:hypothetical protein
MSPLIDLSVLVMPMSYQKLKLSRSPSCSRFENLTGLLVDSLLPSHCIVVIGILFFVKHKVHM